MGLLKDEFHKTVWSHLKSQYRHQTLLLALNAPNVGPQSVRDAWHRLRDNAKTEGISKKIGLQTVLRERQDLFYTHTNERGHLLIALTPTAQELSPDSGLPPLGPAYIHPGATHTATSGAPAAAPTGDATLNGDTSEGPSDFGSLLQGFGEVTEEQAADPAFVAQFAEALKDELNTLNSLSELGGLSCLSAEALQGLAQEPVAKKQKAGSTYLLAADKQGKGVSRGKNGFYQDIVWTPQMAERRAEERKKDASLARAIFNACEIFGGRSVTLSQLGSDFNVSQLKKDTQFKNHKLIDIIRYHENVFEVIPDPSGVGGFVVRLQPGAEAALPDAETYLDELRELDILLPEHIEDPRTQRDKMQALRIELVHAIHRRGGKVALQELGQDQKVQKIKSALNRGQKLIEFVKMFPDNFKIDSDEQLGHMTIQVSSTDVSDQHVIDSALARSQNSLQSSSKGNGRRDNRDGRDRRDSHDARDSRDNHRRERSPPSRSRRSRSRDPPPQYYGHHGSAYGNFPSSSSSLPMSAHSLAPAQYVGAAAFGAPVPGYHPGAPPGYPAGAASAYGAPPPGYPSGAATAYGAPPPGYPPGAAAYGAPPPGYHPGAPPQGYHPGAPPPGPPPAYGAPAVHPGYPGYPPPGYPPPGYPPQP